MRTAMFALAMVLASASARADDVPENPKPIAQGLPSRFEGKKLVWDPAFTHVDASQFVTMGVAAAIAIGTNAVKPRETNWASTTTTDEKVRDALRASSYTGRVIARDTSDVILGLMSGFPFIVDSMMIAYWYRGSEDVARQMFLIDGEAMAVTAAIQGTVTYIGGRQRPYVRDCESGVVPADTVDCQTNSRFRSFFSGHTSQSFVSAALICSHHLNLDLFDSAADPITCGLAFTAAAATGTLRIVGDMHYITDVLTGAAIGTVVGFGLPWFHHYRRKKQAEQIVEVRIVPTVGGLAAVGGF